MLIKLCIINIIIVDDGVSKWVIIDNLYVNVKKWNVCMVWYLIWSIKMIIYNNLFIILKNFF